MSTANLMEHGSTQAGEYEPKYGQGGYGSGYTTPGNRGVNRKPNNKRKWWIIGGIIAILVILGAVLGGVFGSRAADDNDDSSSNSGGSSQNDNQGNGGSSNNANGSGANNGPSATRGSANEAVKPTATDQYGNPMYPSSTGSARIAAPAFTSNEALSCGDDPYSFASGNPLSSVRNEHPRLFAPSYKWQCLPKLIAADSYMAFWNKTIFDNATRLADEGLQDYVIDGDSGALDVARQVQQKIKHWAYAYMLSNDTKWLDRTYRELVHAAGNGTESFGTTGDNWYSTHFLDVGEFTLAFAIAYDWLYDAWSQDQRDAIMGSIVTLGLDKGLSAYAESPPAWWTGVNGNWNCVCNNGLIAGALAIMGDDQSGAAASMLEQAVPNIRDNCAQGPSPDGTWSETPNYWYFGSTGHAQAALALLTATGSTQGLMDSNPGMQRSGLFHMAVTGAQGLFSYGDAGPNKYTATANPLMFYASQYNMPEYSLFQRDRGDAPEPMSMLYYDPQVTGQFWNGLELDHHFSNTTDGWASMRSSWTDNNAVYVAIKAGALLGHQTHGDLDAGTFVLDAMGQRWAGELGNGDYLSTGYFTSESQGSQRWLYYRKRTEGQNTLVLNGDNQNVAGVPSTTFGSTGETQNALAFTVANSSTAFLTTDLTSMYNDTTSVKRGIRMINGRRQVLLQDELNTEATIQWRMHTNATVTTNGGTATLELNGKTLIATILSPQGATFGTQVNPTRLSTDPALPSGMEDQPNTGVTAVTIDLPAGQQTIQVLFNPQYDGASADTYITPPSVAIDDWSLTSHE